ncbi:mevalonate kinase isoform X2 [Amborella trichopoda]|uniref:mevalonate kinase isoform X2 n=1 Tax=Amborella trichopoda TaxID=13333 RepID=UPI0009C039D6|nr:mevalonate kinase isoform X2 [Amborella trichopoda]|eukprot:XP_020525443.1 mevalonate kinase isoform X2 [Amborella trichopoda]
MTLMEIRARAPGKIILCGEHAVVHGCAAVAASIDLCTQVLLQSSQDGDVGLLQLELKDLNLQFSWSISRIQDFLPSETLPLSSSVECCSSDMMERLIALVAEHNIPEANIGLAVGVSAFLWLYISIAGFKTAKAIVTSNLPMGSGLGSSASFCVALSASLLALSGTISSASDQDGNLVLGERERELVNRWAFEGERIIHGRPSGIDNSVSTFGNMIMFKSGELTRIKAGLPLKMLITNTKVGRNTKALVAGVAERAGRHPEAMSSVFKAIDAISMELSTIIQSGASDDLSIIEKEEKLQELMEMNMGLLQSMGVSHASIEMVLQTTLKYKLTSKLTGAGGGGCVLTLLPSYHGNHSPSRSYFQMMDDGGMVGPTIRSFPVLCYPAMLWRKS